MELGKTLNFSAVLFVTEINFAPPAPAAPPAARRSNAYSTKYDHPYMFLLFRVYYNQAHPARLRHLELVNWWAGKLYHSPLLPPPERAYRNFKGRVFQVPVLHAPPWHFVRYNNDSALSVTGGRDDELLALLAKKLNFKYKYFDPPERSQGSSISANGTFRGTLGLIWKRKADFFLGDVTMTWERLQAVEFSFLTLADSAAFLTHAPDKLSETLALIRPFQWEVWPLVCATLIVAGPALWAVIAAPSLWRLSRTPIDQLKLFSDCCWFTTSLFLRQSSTKEPSNTHKARLVSVLVSLGATYVIGDMYSANLTSLMARPAREQPIGTLQALEEAMRDRGYELVVERHSSSLTILQNGTGVYGRLAQLMRRQRVQRVRSVEAGVRLILSQKNVAILGGRETLYFDTERFGSHNFHLSEKLYTRYSAIALQIGCPYIEPFNNVSVKIIKRGPIYINKNFHKTESRINENTSSCDDTRILKSQWGDDRAGSIMTLFEAGILAKMTSDEYKNLPEHARRSQPVTESEGAAADGAEPAAVSQTQAESTKSLEPVTLRMLRGAFCLLGIGYILAALTLTVEVEVHRRSRKKEGGISTTWAGNVERSNIKNLKLCLTGGIEAFRRSVRALVRAVDRALGPAH
ncbi:Ionotropic receptor 40a [Eumeta japonica]|uniref:Ionotropic receptor 40a n=1 Tax=Eumeta variegata TaxID=151549 RepID=A0A4C1VGG9_EUMVA|nr:Ionotropic receptor 40a [Eumeta japonica]